MSGVKGSGITEGTFFLIQSFGQKLFNFRPKFSSTPFHFCSRGDPLLEGHCSAAEFNPGESNGGEADIIKCMDVPRGTVSSVMVYPAEQGRQNETQDGSLYVRMGGFLMHIVMVHCVLFVQ